MQQYKKMIKKWLCNKTPQIWLPVPDHTNRILIIKGSWSGTTNWLFNLINQQLHIDKMYLCAKDSFEAIYQFLIKKRETASLKHFNDSKSFIEYSNVVDDIYKNIEKYN